MKIKGPSEAMYQEEPEMHCQCVGFEFVQMEGCVDDCGGQVEVGISLLLDKINIPQFHGTLVMSITKDKLELHAS